MASDIVPYLDLTIDVGPLFLPDAKNLVSVVRTDWEHEDIIFKEFSTGYNNKLVAFMRSGDARDMNDVIVVRVYGPKTELMIDRHREIRCQRLFHLAGCAPAVLCRFNNGFVYRYAAGRVLDLHHAYDPKVIRTFTKELAKVHSTKAAEEDSGGGGGDCTETQPRLFEALANFLRIISEELDDLEKHEKLSKLEVSHDELEKEVNYLREVLPSLQSPVVLCHNDLLFNNILHNDETGKITFIDFEFAAFNYQAFDIATHFCEYAGMDVVDYSKYPDRNHQYVWLRCYLERYLVLRNGQPNEVSDDEVAKLHSQVDWFTLGAHMFWALWALVQSKYSVIEYDYLDYSSIRIKEYFRKKKELRETIDSVNQI